MITITKAAGVISFLAGLLCLVLAVAHGFSGRSTMAVYLSAASAYGVVSGAALYCLAKLTEYAGVCVERLGEIKKNTDPALSPPPTGARPVSNDISSMRGVFAER